jgi:hypothetical protein
MCLEFALKTAALWTAVTALDLSAAAGVGRVWAALARLANARRADPPRLAGFAAELSFCALVALLRVGGPRLRLAFGAAPVEKLIRALQDARSGGSLSFSDAIGGGRADWARQKVEQFNAFAHRGRELLDVVVFHDREPPTG